MNFFVSNCVEIWAEAVDMDEKDGKLSNVTKVVSIKKSRDELFISGIVSTRVSNVSIVGLSRFCSATFRQLLGF